jgi:hypothetical protein
LKISYLIDKSFKFFCIITKKFVLDNWNKTMHPYKKLEYGKWELHLPPNSDGSCVIKHLSEMKIIILDKYGQLHERLSPWATYVIQSNNILDGTTYKHKIWHPTPENVKNYFKMLFYKK